MIRLIRPTLEYKTKALAYRQEHFDHGEQIINGSELFDKTESYEEWIKTVKDNENAETVNPNWVVTDTFFAVNNEDEIVGIIDLRHTLNEFLKDFGNCGYSVRPSQRRKGYATEMLRQILDVARKADMKELHISVEKIICRLLKRLYEMVVCMREALTLKGSRQMKRKILRDIKSLCNI